MLFAAICTLTKCAAPNQDNTQYINLGKQKVVIYEVYQAKYSVVKFYYPLKLNDTKQIYIYGSNGGSGYYYRKYSLNKGDTVEADVSIYYDGDRIHAADINFNAYEIK